MIEQFKVDQFGVVISGKLDKYVDQLLDLKPDIVQVPFHIYRPSVEACKRLRDNNIKIVGKMVPPFAASLHMDYIEKMFTQFKGLIQIWDFGGEPETKANQPGCRYQGLPCDFVKDVRLFYTIGKEVDSNNIIGGCGWITPTFNGYFGNEDRSMFFAECCSFGIANFLDFISLNFYTYGYGGTKNIFAGIGKVKEILAWHHIKKTVVVSEYGVPCAGDPLFLHIIQTPEKQAVSLVKQSILFNSVGIDYAMWFTLQYKGWGLVDEKGVPRPAYKAFQVMQKILRGSQYKERIKALPSKSVKGRWATDKICWHVFETRGQDIHVIWTMGGLELERKCPREKVEIYDMYGEEHIPDSRKKFFICKEPFYIIANKGVLNQRNFLQV